MIKGLKVFDTPEQLAHELSNRLIQSVNEKPNEFSFSISGGSTPLVLFKKLSEVPFKDNLQWKRIHFFWCDERCVPPNDSESNFGMTKKILFDKIQIPEKNIHRIRGEAEPNIETVRYANDIENFLPKSENKLPQFDWVLLGIGEDGHTASLFPGKNFLFIYSNIACVSQHPATGQKRISLTKDILNNARRITFMVTGKGKAKVLSEILKGVPISKNYPAAEIKPFNGTIEWLVDKEAAFYL